MAKTGTELANQMLDDPFKEGREFYMKTASSPEEKAKRYKIAKVIGNTIYGEKGSDGKTPIYDKRTFLNDYDWVPAEENQSKKNLSIEEVREKQNQLIKEIEDKFKMRAYEVAGHKQFSQDPYFTERDKEFDSLEKIARSLGY